MPAEMELTDREIQSRRGISRVVAFCRKENNDVDQRGQSGRCRYFISRPPAFQRRVVLHNCRLLLSWSCQLDRVTISLHFPDEL
jgi:hypothetical protein